MFKDTNLFNPPINSLSWSQNGNKVSCVSITLFPSNPFNTQCLLLHTHTHTHTHTHAFQSVSPSPSSSFLLLICYLRGFGGVRAFDHRNIYTVNLPATFFRSTAFILSSFLRSASNRHKYSHFFLTWISFYVLPFLKSPHSLLWRLLVMRGF